MDPGSLSVGPTTLALLSPYPPSLEIEDQDLCITETGRSRKRSVHKAKQVKITCPPPPYASPTHVHVSTPLEVSRQDSQVDPEGYGRDDQDDEGQRRFADSGHGRAVVSPVLVIVGALQVCPCPSVLFAA